MTAKPNNIHRKKALLCIWWDQRSILYYELLQPGETVIAICYKQQLVQLNNAKRPKCIVNKYFILFV